MTLGDRWITDWEPSDKWPVYTRANAGEVLPNPCSPLGWDLVWEQGVSHGWADGVHRWGSFVPEESNADQPEFIACFGGYFYLNATAIRMVGERSPGLTWQDMDAAFFGDHPDTPPHTPRPEDHRPELEATIGASMETLLSATEPPQELVDDRQKMMDVRAQRPNLETATDAELVARARSIVPLVREFFEPYYIYGTASSLGPGMLGAVTADLSPGMGSRLISGMGGIDSAPPSTAMWDLSRLVVASESLTQAFDAGLDGLMDRIADETDFVAALDLLRAEHGARGPGEWDIGVPTWEIAPELVLAAVDRMRFADDDMAPENRALRAVADREAAEAEARAALADNAEALGTLELGMHAAKLYVPTRERTKLTSMLANHEIRVAIHALGQRMVDRGVLDSWQELTMLLDAELDDFLADPQAMVATIKERHADFQKLGGLQDPFIIDGTVPPLSEWKARDRTGVPVQVGEELAGVPGSPGIATGKARVVMNPSDPRGLEPGEILVAPITDPAWTPLFVPSEAVVVEVGAPLSHAVIVSREFGVPCVTGVLDATRRIPDGAIISVDGNTGIVTVVELPE